MWYLHKVFEAQQNYILIESTHEVSMLEDLKCQTLRPLIGLWNNGFPSCSHNSTLIHQLLLHASTSQNILNYLKQKSCTSTSTSWDMENKKCQQTLSKASPEMLHCKGLSAICGLHNLEAEQPSWVLKSLYKPQPRRNSLFLSFKWIIPVYLLNFYHEFQQH